MQHPSFGSLVSCKEIEEKLWKFCFYVKIEEYRKSIRKTVSLRDGQEGPDATPAAVSLALKARAHLAKLISAFTKFLSDGTSFYQEFMMKASSSKISFSVLSYEDIVISSTVEIAIINRSAINIDHKEYF